MKTGAEVGRMGISDNPAVAVLSGEGAAAVSVFQYRGSSGGSIP